MAIFIALTSQMMATKSMWKHVSSNYVHKWSKLAKIGIPSGNFNSLRPLHDTVKFDSENNLVPSVPTPLIFQKDLTILDVIEDWVDKEEAIINLGKLIQLGPIVTRLSDAQKACYEWVPNPAIQKYLGNLFFLSEEELEIIISNKSSRMQ
eukprot:TRINITY_DN13617_c0_g1_i1.p1 TRINITY_DN13617_c0_g1~~TRINITY_DN13617_c0_g1_i1.p1  ORF type:complete len:150 (+),score=36.30 TRINITY_DN13617_c0_g1_i1:96-545(+)